MRLFIEPSDVWLFRNAKPFTAGADHRAASRFPPPPTTIQGAIRSKVLLERGVSLADYGKGTPTPETEAAARVIGWPSSQELPFRLAGPFLARREESGGTITQLYPPPADLAQTKTAVGGDRRFVCLRPLQETPFQTDLDRAGGDLLWAATTERLTAPEGWLTEQQFHTYLVDPETLVAQLNQTRVNPNEALVPEHRLFVREPRFGIALEHGVRRPAEGMLFEVEYIRPRQGVGLVVDIGPNEGNEAPAIVQAFGPPGRCGVMALGGESRAARWEVIDAEPPAPLAPLHGRFKVVLLTPALFTKGWEAENWDSFFSGHVELRAAAVGAPESISGWDIARRRPKAARPVVPVGSVYFFESREPVTFRGAFTDANAHLGFGQIATGGW